MENKTQSDLKLMRPKKGVLHCNNSRGVIVILENIRFLILEDVFKYI